LSTINIKVWQRSSSCCCCYIVYHYSLTVDRGEVLVVVTLSTITVYGLTEGWFMLLLLCLPLLFKFWQRSGSCCCCYVVYHFCLWFDRGVVHVLLVGIIFYHYCLMFDRGVVHIVVVILSPITVLCMTEEWFILLLLYCLPLLLKVWQRSGSFSVWLAILSTITVLGLTEEWFILLLLYCLPLLRKVLQMNSSCFGCYVVYHYCLRFDRGVFHVVLVGNSIYHYCLMFDRGMFHVVFVILSTIAV
jgi:hypothetical protein